MHRPSQSPWWRAPASNSPRLQGEPADLALESWDPPRAQKASHFTQQHDVGEEIKKHTPTPPSSRLSADLFHVPDVLSHFRCCHYTRLGYFQWKYLRRNENSFGKNKYPELSLLCTAMWWDLERVKMCERKSLFMREAAVKQDKPGFTALRCCAWAVSSVGVSHLETTCNVKKHPFYWGFLCKPLTSAVMRQLGSTVP